MQERFPSHQVPMQWTPEDIEAELDDTEPELLRYFRLLPKELWKKHFETLEGFESSAGEKTEASKEHRINYILGVIEAREHAIVDYGVAEETLRERLSSAPEGIEGFGRKLGETLLASGNLLGSGTTARVKSMHIDELEWPIAVKYLLTPTKKTLSINAEYDMLREVETITKVENAARRLGAGQYIRVPHPHFYYKRGKLQCYGMSQIDGATLEEVMADENKRTSKGSDALVSLKKRLASPEAKDAFRREVDIFMRAMHEICLHGDIKYKNLMLDEQGVLYLIDFGQSVAMMNMTQNTREQFENLQDHERAQMDECVRGILKKLN